MATTADEWIRRFAERVGVPAPDAAEIEALLGMAGTAAHASERTAAPISTWLAARAGLTPTAALAVAKELGADLEAELGAEPSAEPSPAAADEPNPSS
ncbi:MAG: DUF6457 domain-containing protein [Acidimicrobiales bacterium]|jgi:hypothetical protein